MSKARLLFVCLFFFVALVYTPAAFAVQVGVAEPFAGRADDQYGTLERRAQIGVNSMSDLGLNWHREWISWKDWQPARPTSGNPSLNPGSVQLLDRVEAMSRAKSLNTYVMIYNSPSWVNGSSDIFYIPGNGNPQDPAFQKYAQDYGDFIYQLVSTYRGRIDHWEIGCEPDLPDYWHTNQPTTVQQRATGYAYLLKVAYLRAKEANPQSVIMMAGVTGWHSDEFMQKLYQVGAGPYFDKAAIHPYTELGYGDLLMPSESRLFSKIGSMRQIMDQNGDSGKAIWVTETGWTTSGNNTSRRVTESEQSNYAVDALQTVISRYPSVEVVTLFRLMDTNWYGSTDSDSGFGLLNTDYYRDGVASGHALYSPKPAFYALKLYLSNETPQLLVRVQRMNWGSYADYLNRNLSLDFSVDNTSVSQARSVTITAVEMSQMVQFETALPIHLGDIAPGATSPFYMGVHVPENVTMFRIHFQGQAQTDSGTVVRFP